MPWIKTERYTIQQCIEIVKIHYKKSLCSVIGEIEPQMCEKHDFLKSNEFIFVRRVFLIRIEEMKLKKRFLKFKWNLFLSLRAWVIQKDATQTGPLEKDRLMGRGGINLIQNRLSDVIYLRHFFCVIFALTIVKTVNKIQVLFSTTDL